MTISTFKNLLGNMKALTSFFLITAPSLVVASLANPLWGVDWTPSVTDSYCMLIRKYEDRSEVNAEFPALPNRVIFDSFTVRFSIHNEMSGISEPVLPKGKLYFFLVASSSPNLGVMQQRIANVRIKSYRLKKHEYPRSSSYSFYLENEQAQAVFESLKEDETLTLVLELMSGETTKLDIPNKPPNRFNVWANMLEACAATNAT